MSDVVDNGHMSDVVDNGHICLMLEKHIDKDA